jgi:hypothetical protein
MVDDHHFFSLLEYFLEVHQILVAKVYQAKVYCAFY